MQEGFQRLESTHPHQVIEQVNKIADLLNIATGFRFAIVQDGLASIIEIETGTLSDNELREIQKLALADNTTTVTIENSQRKARSITVTLKPSQLS